MASAFHDPRNARWIADFRGLHMAGRRRRRVVVPAHRARTPDDARAFARECEAYCRLIESGTATPPDVAHALRLGAITPEQAGAAATGRPLDLPGSEPTLEGCWLAHPCTDREGREDPATWSRRRHDLAEFRARTGLTLMRDLSLRHVQDWLAALRQAGAAHATRRHKLIPVRRAAAMAPGLGLPDVIHGLRLDERSDPPPVRVWTLPQLAVAARAAESSGDRRALAILALGGLLGLRPTEIVRALPEDLDGDLLHVGARERKNSPSARLLPLPEPILGWIRDLAATRPAGRSLVGPDGHGTRLAVCSCRSAGAALGRALDAAGVGRLDLKCLRKSFATWTIGAGLDAHAVEAWLGHRSALVGSITARHYLARAGADRLRPLSDQIGRLVADQLQTAPTRQRRTRKAA